MQEHVKNEFSFFQKLRQEHEELVTNDSAVMRRMPNSKYSVSFPMKAYF